MLTAEQLEKLQPYVEHNWYGALLKSAIECWKIHNPHSGLFGLRIESTKTEIDTTDKFIYDERYEGCCLVGAALFNTTVDIHHSTCGNCVKTYNLSIDEISALIIGFDMADNSIPLTENALFRVKDIAGTEAYKFAFEVGKIVLS